VSAPWIAAFAALSTLVGLIVVVLLGFLRRASAVLEEASERLAGAETPARSQLCSRSSSRAAI
jgi:hypothetical protein